jgi:hypothetical protein
LKLKNPNKEKFMKKMSLLIAMMIAMPLSSQAKVISCRGEDRGHTGLKFQAQGNMKEQAAYGQTFMVGDFKIQIKEPGKPVWEVTLPLAIPVYPITGNTNIVGLPDGGGYLYEEGRGSNKRQLDVRDLLSGGSYVSYFSPAAGSVGDSNYNIDIECKGFDY